MDGLLNPPSKTRECIDPNHQGNRDLTDNFHFVDAENISNLGRNAILCPKCAQRRGLTPESSYNLTSFNLQQHKTAQTILRITLKGQDVDLDPRFFHEDCGGEEEVLENFIDNLHDDECSIIAQHGRDLQKLRHIKTRSDHDVANTAKDLAME